MKRPLIGLAISAVLFVLSIDLCGMGGSSHSGGSQVSVYLGLICLACSLLGGLGSLVWLIVALVRGR